MLHSCIFLFILAGVLPSSSCLQRSDYIYDRETRMVTLTTNGTTYTCRAWDITDPALDRDMKSIKGPCLNGEQSVDDPKCIRMDVVNILSHVGKDMQAEQGGPSSCDAPIPSLEETLDRIVKVYRSSLDDNPATKEWLKEALENVTRLKTECEANETRQLYPEMLQKAAQWVLAGFMLGHRELPELRGNVSQAQTVLEEAKGAEAGTRAALCSLPSYVEDDFHDLRESLFVTEVIALGDSHEFELYTWNQLAEARTKFVNAVSTQKKLNHSLTLATQKVVEAEMDVLFKMAQANEMLARIEYIKREVEYNLENACETILHDFD